MKVAPSHVVGNGLYNWITGRKKWTITCGACQHTWKEKVPLHDIASAICSNPSCGAQNLWFIEAFERAYRAALTFERVYRAERTSDG